MLCCSFFYDFMIYDSVLYESFINVQFKKKKQEAMSTVTSFMMLSRKMRPSSSSNFAKAVLSLASLSSTACIFLQKCYLHIDRYFIARRIYLKVSEFISWQNSSKSSSPFLSSSISFLRASTSSSEGFKLKL